MNKDVKVDRSQLKLDRRRVDALPRDVLVAELRRVAELLGGRRFSRRDFDRHAIACKGSVVLSHFGSWHAALDSIGVPLKDYRYDRKQITDAQLLNELARVWSGLGHRPSKLEWEASDAAYSYTTYKQRFGGWVNACAVLVSGAIDIKPPAAIEPRPQPSTKPPPEMNRTVPLKLRLRVLTRDKFRCVLCSRTPAINPGTVLHVDHIVPFSGGGPTAESNLRTLCDQCNWGKGADHERAV
ncbi:MAG: HNH endonuclease [Deltaproteobacteria bacterium]|nr:HNH endonuclease [Deltaproteobacteria bacterium]MDZ4343619.1 HNH endonuclease [Candidatus Binatia bacterium]